MGAKKFKKIFVGALVFPSKTQEKIITTHTQNQHTCPVREKQIQEVPFSKERKLVNIIIATLLEIKALLKSDQKKMYTRSKVGYQ